MLHLNLISVVDGSTLNWCEQKIAESLSEELLFAKKAEPDMTAVIFINHFRDCLGERVRVEGISKCSQSSGF